MLSISGVIQDNSVVLENDSLNNYEGKQIILTILDSSVKKERKKIDWDGYGFATDRGKKVDEYMESIRSNDRL